MTLKKLTTNTVGDGRATPVKPLLRDFVPATLVWSFAGSDSLDHIVLRTSVRCDDNDDVDDDNDDDDDDDDNDDDEGN